MRITASVKLVWQLAARETVSAAFKEICPEHFLEALLRFSEISREQAHELSGSVQIGRELNDEVERVRGELIKRSVETTTARRELRSRLGKGNHPYEGHTVHRASASRDLFDTAVKIANDEGSEVLSVQHLLQALFMSPHNIIAELIGEATDVKTAMQRSTPHLDKWGQDLCALAEGGKQNEDVVKAPEIIALLRTLGQKDGNNAMLISDSDEFVGAVVAATACAMIRNETSSEIRRMRIFDVTSVCSSDVLDAQALGALEGILQEVADIPEIILYLPAIKMGPDGDKLSAWGEMLKKALLSKHIRCICRVTPSVYEKYITRDMTWKRVARAMWLHPTKYWKVPSRL